MTRTLRISPDLSLPVGAVTQKFAVLGNSGSGKTYGAGKLVEELLDAGAQVVVIDTVGNWFGLRLAGDGKKPGIAIPILGGERGDVALEPHAGKLAAETVAETKASMILDVSDFIQADLRRFVIDFATALLALKKRAKSPVMVVWEECQDIVPQRVMGEDARMVGAVQRLIKKGRNYGVGTTLISQRPAAVNKDVLNLIETLLAFRTLGTSDRKQISDWVVSHAKQAEDLVDDLASLPTGTCFCWSPVWLGIFEKIRIGKKRTFDASATPEFGEEVVAGTLAPVDLDRFKKRMADAVEKAKAADPAEMRKRIAELERQLRAKPAAAAPAAAKVEVKTVEKPVIKPAELKRLEAAIAAGAGVVAALEQSSDTMLGRIDSAIARVGGALDGLKETIAAFNRPATVPIVGRVPGPPPSSPTHGGRVYPSRHAAVRQTPAPTDGVAGDGSMPPRQVKVLGAVAWWSAIGIDAPSVVGVAFVAGYSPTNSSFEKMRGALRSAGLVDYPSAGTMRLTPEGWKVTPRPTAPGTLAELHAKVLARLEPRHTRILQPVLDAFPDALSVEALAAASGYSPTNSSFEKARGKLRSLGLFEYPRPGAVRATDVLFPEVLRG